MNAAEAGGYRALLEAERTRLSSAIANLHENGRTAEEEGADAGGHGGDSASITVERELGEGLEESVAQTLAQIERALQRLSDGSYATCERCGKPIGSERLHARPWATLCIDDQRRADRG